MAIALSKARLYGRHVVSMIRKPKETSCAVRRRTMGSVAPMRSSQPTRTVRWSKAKTTADARRATCDLQSKCEGPRGVLMAAVWSVVVPPSQKKYGGL